MAGVFSDLTSPRHLSLDKKPPGDRSSDPHMTYATRAVAIEVNRPLPAVVGTEFAGLRDA